MNILRRASAVRASARRFCRAGLRHSAVSQGTFTSRVVADVWKPRQCPALEEKMRTIWLLTGWALPFPNGCSQPLPRLAGRQPSWRPWAPPVAVLQVLGLALRACWSSLRIVCGEALVLIEITLLLAAAPLAGDCFCGYLIFVLWPQEFGGGWVKTFRAGREVPAGEACAVRPLSHASAHFLCSFIEH